MKRDERAALLLMHEAAATALRASLEADAEHEHAEHGVAASWRMAPATVTANIANTRVGLDDPQAFLRYLKERHPDEIVERLEPRATAWVNRMRAALLPFAERDPETLAPTGRIVDADGVVVPGVSLWRGGRYLSASVKPNADHAAVLAAAAEYAVRTGEWGPLWAYTADNDPAIVVAMMDERPDGNGREPPQGEPAG